jgi:hypothetical protein
VKRRLERLWTRWSFKDKLGLLSTAEALARAEKAKRASTRTSKKTDYLAMSLAGVAAFKLAEQVSRLLPPPWDAEHAVIGKFCRQLTGFGGAALYATGVSDRELAVGFAERLIRDLRRTSRSHTR